MTNCCSLTLRVGRIRLVSESRATSMGQLFMRRSSAGSVSGSRSVSEGEYEFTNPKRERGRMSLWQRITEMLARWFL